MDVTPAIVELHVEELILEGIPQDARHAVGDALQAELTRLLVRAPPIFADDASIPRIAAAPVAATTDAGPAALGTAVAREVHRSLPTERAR